MRFCAGGLAGGCNFVSSYQCRLQLAFLCFFAGKAKDFGVVVEQAEDEISAVNMALVHGMQAAGSCHDLGRRVFAHG